MKCKHCGAQMDKSLICPKCGLSYPPRKLALNKILMIAGGSIVVLSVLGFFIALKIYDKMHQDNALLPGIYAGMTKQELYAVLKNDYPALYDGKVLENPKARKGADPMSYVSYAEYCNVLGLRNAMELEVSFVTSGNTQYVDSYTLSLPYTVGSTDATSGEIIQDDINTHLIPMLERKYGPSIDSDVEYEQKFGIRESVRLTVSRTDQLLDFKNYSKTDFSIYGSQNYCTRIAYQGSSSHTIWNVLKYVE